jgi:hypothetical protein
MSMCVCVINGAELELFNTKVEGDRRLWKHFGKLSTRAGP